VLAGVRVVWMYVAKYELELALFQIHKAWHENHELYVCYILTLALI